MNDGEGNGGGAATATDPPAEAASKSTNRQYGVFHELVIDLMDEPQKTVDKLKEIIGKDSDGKQIEKITVLARVGRAISDTPTKAIKAVGASRDLQGDYDVIADSSRTTFKGVVSKVERTVQIG